MVAAMLKVLGDPTRIRLIELLNDRGGATVSALAACFSVSQQRISQHLAALYEVGIVSRRRQGIYVHYELIDFTCWWVIQQLSSGLRDEHYATPEQGLCLSRLRHKAPSVGVE